jgi:hypothetical protein
MAQASDSSIVGVAKSEGFSEDLFASKARGDRESAHRSGGSWPGIVSGISLYLSVNPVNILAYKI